MYRTDLPSLRMLRAFCSSVERAIVSCVEWRLSSLVWMSELRSFLQRDSGEADVKDYIDKSM